MAPVTRARLASAPATQQLNVKADINGAAKIAGTGSETCASAADIGKMRYNPSAGYFEYAPRDHGLR